MRQLMSSKICGGSTGGVSAATDSDASITVGLMIAYAGRNLDNMRVVLCRVTVQGLEYPHCVENVRYLLA